MYILTGVTVQVLVKLSDKVGRNELAPVNIVVYISQVEDETLSRYVWSQPGIGDTIVRFFYYFIFNILIIMVGPSV